MKMTKKLLSGILVASMLVSVLPMCISAACTHHTKHDETCGFAAEVPCAHVGDGAVHDGTCGYVPEKPCTYAYEYCPQCKEEAAATYPNSPVYIIKSGEGSFILNVYQNGKMTQTETKNSNGFYTPMKFVDNANYAPFRYLFEEFGLAEASVHHCNATNLEELHAFDMSDVPIPAGHNGVYIALYNYGEGKDKRIEINGTKRIVLLVKLASNPTEKVILMESEDLTDSKGRPLYDENGNKVTGKVKILNNSTYIPLRALQLCDMHVRYDANAKAAYIFPKSLEYAAKEQDILKDISQKGKIDSIPLAEADRALYKKASIAYNSMISNSYVNYSKAYKKADGSVSAMSGVYGVNQVGDYKVYVNEALKITVAKEDDKGNLETFPVASDKIFLCDTVIFDGYNVYGTKVKDPGTVAGTVFVAKLTRTNDGYKLIDYKEVPVIDAAHNLRLDSNRLYFIDDNDNCKIKSVSTSGAGETIRIVAENPNKQIFAFDVCNGNIFYDNYNDKAYLNGVEFPNAEGMYVREVVANQKFNGTEGDMFYYTLENGDANYLYAIRKDNNGNITSVLVDCTWNGHKLRNLTMIDGVVYASANGNLVKMK